MKILGIETSAKVASTALLCDDIIVSEFTLNAGFTHSQTIMPMVNSVLEQSSITLDQIDAFAVVTGPGSFTGVRIGVSLAKGLALPNNTKCIGISSLESLAYNLIGFDGYICPVMDARRSQVYTALFQCENGTITRINNDDILKIDELREKIANLDKSLFFVGDGAEMCYNALGNINSNFRIAPITLRNSHASSVCLIAKQHLDKNDFVDAQHLSPLYLRLSQAERELKQKNKT